MTDEEMRLIKSFVENKPIYEAVCRVLLQEEVIAHDIPDQDDAAYGRAVRVWVKARELINERLVQLVRISSTNPQPSPMNHAR